MSAKKRAPTKRAKKQAKKVNTDDKRIGNQFWKLRSRHGRKKIFETPELLWEAACEYFEWVEDNPFRKQEAIKSGELAGTTMDVTVMRPYTMEGLCHYLGCNTGYFYDFVKSLNKETKQDKDFSEIVTRIRETVYRQKFEGAASNFLNANIIARDLGLQERRLTSILGHLADQ